VEDFDERKISDYKLRDFAESGEANERGSVIVELDIPPRAMLRPEWQQTPWKKGSYPGLTDYTASGEEENVENDIELMNQLEEKLVSLDLPEKPVRLDAAQAFVVSVTPEQLRNISRFSLAGLIRPNRVHRIPRS
jgi:hypothetical protein